MQDTSETDLPTLVCLHSLFLDPRMFNGLVEAAAGRFRVVRPTFRGQGEVVGEVNARVTMQTCADDVFELVDGLGVGAVGVVAQSMGADVAVRVAAPGPTWSATWWCWAGPLGRSRRRTSKPSRRSPTRSSGRGSPATPSR